MTRLEHLEKLANHILSLDSASPDGLACEWAVNEIAMLQFALKQAEHHILIMNNRMLDLMIEASTK
jgi:hypothetical protein